VLSRARGNVEFDGWTGTGTPAILTNRPTYKRRDCLTTFSQEFSGLVGTFVILFPSNAQGASYVLVTCTVLELAYFSYTFSRSEIIRYYTALNSNPHLNTAHKILFASSYAVLEQDTTPFENHTEQLIYALELVVAILTHSVGVRCANTMTLTPTGEFECQYAGSDTDGVFLLFLHSLFAAMYLGLMCYYLSSNHSSMQTCEGTDKTVRKAIIGRGLKKNPERKALKITPSERVCSLCRSPLAAGMLIWMLDMTHTKLLAVATYLTSIGGRLRRLFS
jgi:hypothetical protein